MCLGKSGTQSGALLPLSLAVLACPCGVSAPALMLPVLVVFASDNIHYVINKPVVCHFFFGAGSLLCTKTKQAINQ